MVHSTPRLESALTMVRLLLKALLHRTVVLCGKQKTGLKCYTLSAELAKKMTRISYTPLFSARGMVHALT
jgi:hypothetical protein